MYYFTIIETVNKKLITKYCRMNAYPFHLSLNASARRKTNVQRSLFQRIWQEYGSFLQTLIQWSLRRCSRIIIVSAAICRKCVLCAKHHNSWPLVVSYYSLALGTRSDECSFSAYSTML